MNSLLELNFNEVKEYLHACFARIGTSAWNNLLPFCLLNSWFLALLHMNEAENYLPSGSAT